MTDRGDTPSRRSQASDPAGQQPEAPSTGRAPHGAEPESRPGPRERGHGAPFSPVVALLLAVLFVSSSAIVVRFTEAAPLAVAGWRLGLAALILLMLPQARSGWRGLATRDMLRVAAAALFLAVHFGAWIASLRLLPVAVSVLLVSTHPLFVVAARTIAGDVPRFTEMMGIVLALAGLATMQLIGADPRGPIATGTLTMGTTLALIGAAALAAYLLIGADVRQRLRTSSYLVLVYGLASVALFAFLFGAGGHALPAGKAEFALYGILALVPTIGGHGLFAYAVGHVRPVVVSVCFLAEPLVATLLAIPVLHEIPNTRTILGGLLLLVGLALVVAQPGPEPPDAGDALSEKG